MKQESLVRVLPHLVELHRNKSPRLYFKCVTLPILLYTDVVTSILVTFPVRGRCIVAASLFLVA